MEMYDADTGETADDPWQYVPRIHWAVGEECPSPNCEFQHCYREGDVVRARAVVDAQHRTVLADLRTEIARWERYKNTRKAVDLLTEVVNLRTALAEKDDAMRQLRLDLSDGQRLMDERDGARLAYRSVAERFGVVEAQLAAAQDACDALAERDSHAVDAVCQQLKAQLAERDSRITELEADVKRWRTVGEHYEQQWAAEHAVPPVTGDRG